MTDGDEDVEEIRLDVGDSPPNLVQVLKLANCVMSGGEAKNLVADGLVKVNGEPESRKRRQMSKGDVVEILEGPRIILE